MNKTYANANRVLVWLGPDEQMMAESAFDRIRDLHNILKMVSIANSAFKVYPRIRGFT